MLGCSRQDSNKYSRANEAAVEKKEQARAALRAAIACQKIGLHSHIRMGHEIHGNGIVIPSRWLRPRALEVGDVIRRASLRIPMRNALREHLQNSHHENRATRKCSMDLAMGGKIFV